MRHFTNVVLASIGYHIGIWQTIVKCKHLVTYPPKVFKFGF